MQHLKHEPNNLRIYMYMVLDVREKSQPANTWLKALLHKAKVNHHSRFGSEYTADRMSSTSLGITQKCAWTPIHTDACLCKTAAGNGDNQRSVYRKSDRTNAYIHVDKRRHVTRAVHTTPLITTRLCCERCSSSVSLFSLLFLFLFLLFIGFMSREERSMVSVSMLSCESEADE